ncbi:MAG TPA: hypothetical protein VF230_12290, partial [Acidimicrobiales bacterium]
ALTDMREALDTRVALEVAIVRITAPEADASPAALLERLERLERRLDGQPVVAQAAPTPVAAPPAAPADPVVPTPAAAPTPAPAAAEPPQPPPPDKPGGRGALGAFRKGTPPPPPPPRGPQAAAAPPVGAAAPATSTSSPPAAGDLPTRDELTLAWGDHILPTLRGRARALYSVGRFVSVDAGSATFALDNEFHRDQCAALQADVESALAAHFGRRIPLRLVTESSTTAPAAGGDTSATPPVRDADDDETNVSVAEVRAMEAAPGGPNSPAERVKLAFPGATEVEGQS